MKEHNSRRKFLKKSGAALSCSVVFPSIWVKKSFSKGKEILKFDYRKETGQYSFPDQFLPTETAVTPSNGDIYIADGYDQNFIVQYNQKGEYIRHFGGKGNTNDTFDCCHGVLVDTRDPKNPGLLVTDRSHMQLKRFTLDGKYLSTIPVPDLSFAGLY